MNRNNATTPQDGIANSAPSPRQLKVLQDSFERTSNSVNDPKQDDSFEQKTSRTITLSGAGYGRAEEIDAVQAREILRAAGIDPEELCARVHLRFQALAEEYAGKGRPLPELLQLALAELDHKKRLEPALTDCGIYHGAIVEIRGGYVVQQITSQSAVIHQEDLLDTVPSVGQHVRIRYGEGVARVEEVCERSRIRELSR